MGGGQGEGDDVNLFNSFAINTSTLNELSLRGVPHFVVRETHHPKQSRRAGRRSNLLFATDALVRSPAKGGIRAGDLTAHEKFACS